jgi:hypothetical protein
VTTGVVDVKEQSRFIAEGSDGAEVLSAQADRSRERTGRKTRPASLGMTIVGWRREERAPPLQRAANGGRTLLAGCVV